MIRVGTLPESYKHYSLNTVEMSTSLIRQSRKRKRESSSSSKANFFRRRLLQNEVFQSDSTAPAFSPPARVSSSKVRKVRRSLGSRLRSKKRKSTSSSRDKGDSSQLTPVSGDSARKKGLKMSLNKLPKLFSRLLGLNSKSDNESIASPEGECSAESITHSKTSQPRRWTKFMMHLTGNKGPSSTQQSKPPTSVSCTHSSSSAHQGPSTFQVDKASPVLRQLPTSGSAKDAPTQKTVIGSVRKIGNKRQTSTRHQTDVGVGTLSSSIPRVIGNRKDNFSLGINPKQEPSSKVQSRRSSVVQERHSESPMNSDGTKCSFEKMVGRSRHQEVTQSPIVKSGSTSPSKSDPFGDIPPISVPVLEPIRVPQPSWRKMQRKFSKRAMKRQFSEPMVHSCGDKYGDGVDKNPVKSQVPSKSLPSSQSYPLGNAASIFFPVPDSVHVGPTCHKDSTPVAKESHLQPSQPVSTQILKPVQNEKISSSCSLPVAVKCCPESTQTELDHLITHTGRLARSSVAIGSVTSPKLDSECAGRYFTFTSTFSRSLPKQKMSERLFRSSSTNALTSVSSSHRFSSWSNSSSSGNSSESAIRAKSSYSTGTSPLLSKPGNFGRIIKKSSKIGGPKSYSGKIKGSFQVGTASSSFSSSCITFKNSSETINSFGLKRTSMSMTNLLLADSATSGSVGSDAGNSSDRGISTEGQSEFVASSSTANKFSDSHSADCGKTSSLVRQQSIKWSRRRTQGKRRFFEKLISAFSTADKNKYEELLESKSELAHPGTEKSVRKSKKK